MGFKVKINTIVFRGLNDTELHDFIQFSARYAIPVRFLEYMKIGVGVEQFDQFYVSAKEMIRRIETRTQLTSYQVAEDSTTFKFKTDSGAHIGFIASESQPFCGTCSRLRLTPKGELRPCLFVQAGTPLRGLSPGDVKNAVMKILNLKPLDRLESVNQPMNQIGG